jgi:cytochrome o ubiquinol oxidase subunit IV
MSHEISLKEAKKLWHGSLKSYVIGIVLSFILTGISFGLAITHPVSSFWLITLLISMALIQSIVQLIFFLHLGQEEHPKWESLVFYFMVLVLFIIAIGSIWIMHDLDQRVMSNMPMEMTHD